MNDFDPPKSRVVYRPSSQTEAIRRATRAEQAKTLIKFIPLPGNPPDHKVMFVASDGTKVRARDVEMVYNDAAFMDFVSDYGQDGPLYVNTIDGLQREVYDYAMKAYAQ